MKMVQKMMALSGIMAMLALAGECLAQEVAITDSGNAVVSGAVSGDLGPACASGNCGVSYGHGGWGNNGDCQPRPGQPCPQAAPPTDCIGAVGPHGQRYLGPGRTAALAARDHYSPAPLYAYSPHGLDATRFDYWNRNTMAPQYAWHGNYKYWRYGVPTALVVPPTAAFMTEYNWGVAQTRSMPIYHQFTGNQAAAYGLVVGETGVFQNPPYWPSSTSQLGLYPVRGPW